MLEPTQILNLLGFLIIYTVAFIFIWRNSRNEESTTRLFSIAFIVLIVMTVLVGLFCGRAEVDIQMHDTYFVIAQFHFVALLSLIVGLNAGLYLMIFKLFSSSLNRRLGRIHFWVTIIGIFLLLCMIHVSGLVSVSKRYFTYENHGSFKNLLIFNKGILYGLLFALAAQWLFVVNVIYTVVKSYSVSSKTR